MLYWIDWLFADSCVISELHWGNVILQICSCFFPSSSQSFSPKPLSTALKTQPALYWFSVHVCACVCSRGKGSNPHLLIISNCCHDTTRPMLARCKVMEEYQYFSNETSERFTVQIIESGTVCNAHLACQSSPISLLTFVFVHSTYSPLQSTAAKEPFQA